MPCWPTAAVQDAIIKRATPTGLIVRADQVDALEKALLAAGELPARSSDPEDARRGSILLDEDGTVRFVHCRAQPLRLRPTPALLRPDARRLAHHPGQRGAGAGRRAGCRGHPRDPGRPWPWPASRPALQARIKAWSKHYGSASIQSLTLAQFRDQDALDELLQDPELAPLLRPFKPEARLGLAIVEPEAVEPLRHLLAGRGVEVT